MGVEEGKLSIAQVTAGVMRAVERWRKLQGQVEQAANQVAVLREGLRERGIDLRIDDFDSIQEPQDETTRVDPVIPARPPREEASIEEVPPEAVDTRTVGQIRIEAQGVNPNEDSTQFRERLGGDMERAIAQGMADAERMAGGNIVR